MYMYTNMYMYMYEIIRKQSVSSKRIFLIIESLFSMLMKLMVVTVESLLCL